MGHMLLANMYHNMTSDGGHTWPQLDENATCYSKLCKSIFIWTVNTTELQLLLFKNKTILLLFFLIWVEYVNYKKEA